MCIYWGRSITLFIYNHKLHKLWWNSHMLAKICCQSNLFVQTYRVSAWISITCIGFDIFGSYDSNFNLVHVVLIARFVSRFSYVTTNPNPYRIIFVRILRICESCPFIVRHKENPAIIMLASQLVILSFFLMKESLTTMWFCPFPFARVKDHILNNLLSNLTGDLSQ